MHTSKQHERILKIVKQHYSERGTEFCFNLLADIPVSESRLRAKIRHIAADYNIHQNTWCTASAIEIIRKYYPKGGAKACMPHLPGVSANKISSRAYRLGIKTLGTRTRTLKPASQRARELRVAREPKRKGPDAFLSLPVPPSVFERRLDWNWNII